MDGFIVLNKPLGPSSHEVTAWAGKLLDSKAGHAGTLDPQAGGVLVIALGRAMKTLLALSECDKEYVCVARFEKDVDAEQLKKTLKEFTGRIYQTPPKESAVRKVMRTRVVHRTKLLEVAGRLALFRAHVQHGTYIRTLCSDMGEVMGNACEMLELLRTRAGPFSEMVTLQDVADEPDKFIMPIEAGVKQLKKIVVRDSAVSAIAH
ncbi:MAG: RNA-guided pseudouridylation complex pseudouridine synthase subunit Cbf5, partial [Candidatus Diapherotrites archaeon]|nr:RNA-guided pseudouridylation complex pseudouridine synthase subunit Cbf5 [Candidatus Diapherotrites archaeon]